MIECVYCSQCTYEKYYLKSGYTFECALCSSPPRDPNLVPNEQGSIFSLFKILHLIGHQSD